MRAAGRKTHSRVPVTPRCERNAQSLLAGSQPAVVCRTAARPIIELEGGRIQTQTHHRYPRMTFLKAWLQAGIVVCLFVVDLTLICFYNPLQGDKEIYC